MTHPKSTTAQALDHAAQHMAEIARIKRGECYRAVADSASGMTVEAVAGITCTGLVLCQALLAALVADQDLALSGDIYHLPEPRRAA